MNRRKAGRHWHYYVVWVREMKVSGQFEEPRKVALIAVENDGGFWYRLTGKGVDDILPTPVERRKEAGKRFEGRNGNPTKYGLQKLRIAFVDHIKPNMETKLREVHTRDIFPYVKAFKEAYPSCHK